MAEVTRLRIAAGVWMLMACVVAISAEGSLPLKGAIEATREHILQRCSSGDLPTANTMSAQTEELFAKSGAEKFLNCECVPQRLAVIAASDAAKANGVDPLWIRDRLDLEKRMPGIIADVRKVAELPAAAASSLPISSTVNSPRRRHGFSFAI